MFWLNINKNLISLPHIGQPMEPSLTGFSFFSEAGGLVPHLGWDSSQKGGGVYCKLCKVSNIDKNTKIFCWHLVKLFIKLKSKSREKIGKVTEKHYISKKDTMLSAGI